MQWDSEREEKFTGSIDQQNNPCIVAYKDFLQTTESKPWILNHTDRINTYHVEADEMTVNDCSKETLKCSSYRRECWKIVQGDRFLTRHIESEFTDRFLCLKFLPRSKSVIQISTSHIKPGTPNDYLCRDQWLALDPWPWISHEHYSLDDKTSCPFTGGYNFDMYFNSGLMNINHKCTDTIPPVRIESDCTEGEGITFRFRNRNCLHTEGNFDLVQKTTCIASWEEGGDKYAILRKNNDRYFWCIRVLFSPNGDVAKIFVFLDWVCQSGNINNNRLKYLQMDKIGKKNITHECTDEFYACESVGEYCATEVKDVCPRTCGQCHSNETIQYCTFPQSILGSWVKSTLQGNEKIAIENSSLVYAQIGKFRCVTFDKEIIPLRRVLLQEFSNGCYPRFSCLQYNTPSPSVMRFRLSKVMLWPVFLSDARICDDDNFKTLVDTERLDIKTSETFPLQSIVRESNNENYVTCNLPSSMKKVSAFVDNHGKQGCIVQGTFSKPRTIFLSYMQNGGVTDTIEYRCIGSVTYISSLKSIIISRQLDAGDKQYFCWIVLNKNEIIQVPAASCNTFTAKAIQRGDESYSNLLMKRLILQKESSNCASANKTMAHLAQDWTVPPPFSKEISSASAAGIIGITYPYVLISVIMLSVGF
ncbi:hypothetical protein LOTGIDRAFT_160489 [Lottia gigantea]|uniref:ShKT domain-containing protein n=1 Tax=Lottia gigantea TaxID=225164 RepID=V4AET0_LOTGI|nr:hypothetical protein LOTGIDRAFT_160489 [Lottia gigantea]ESO95357.1 hypothetical protein LOTGIDRAFT_160489 [Lottia gigantea]